MKKRIRKKIVALVTLFSLVLTMGLAGCGNSTSSGSATDSKASDTSKKELKVALLLPGTINDQGFSALAYQALQSLEKDYGAKTSYSESVAASDYEQVFRGYASQGFDLIIGHGYQFTDAAIKVAQEFPKVQFCITNGITTKAPNVNAISIDSNQFGFLTGAVATVLSKNKNVGAVAGDQSPPMSKFKDSFVAGAKYLDPNVKATGIIAGTLTDSSKIKETALTLIDGGADVISQNANQAGLGAITAAQERKIMDVGAIGNQASIAPDTVAVSVMQDLKKAIVAAFKLAQEGNLKGEVYSFGVKEGAIYLSDYGTFDSKIPQESKDKIQGVLDDMKSGKINVNNYLEKK